MTKSCTETLQKATKQGLYTKVTNYKVKVAANRPNNVVKTNVALCRNISKPGTIT